MPIDPNSVVFQLDAMGRIEKDIEVLTQAQEAARRVILAPVQAQLDALTAQYAPDLQHLADKRAALEASVKTDVKMLGESVKGTHFQAVFAKGRVSWNDDQLMGYAVAGHPEIEAFRSVGDPSVSMRKVALKEAK